MIWTTEETENTIRIKQNQCDIALIHKSSNASDLIVNAPELVRVLRAVLKWSSISGIRLPIRNEIEELLSKTKWKA